MLCPVDVCSWDEACILCSGGGVHVCFVLLISVAGTRYVCYVQVVVYMYVLFC